MGKANVAKKKQWRRLPSAEVAPVREAQEQTTAALPANQLFVEDRKGDQGAARRNYPEKFASRQKPKAKATETEGKVAETKEKDTEAGVFDLWGEETQGKKKEKEEHLAHIPAIIPPKSGQSYNPKKDSLKATWKKVVEEETAKEKSAAEYERTIHGYQVVETDTAVLSSSDDPESTFRRNPPTVNRKPTKAKVNRKLRFLLRRKEEEEEQNRKEMNKAVEEIPQIIAETEEKKPLVQAERAAAEKRQREEREAESAGLKAPKIRMGQFVYRLPDTEVVYSEEAKPLRQLRPKATAVDSCFDSLVRRGKVDLCGAKRKPKVITRSRLTGELSKELQQDREKKRREEAAGTIKVPTGDGR